MAEINDKIKKQVEFYFSDSNFRKDKFLKAAAATNLEGFVPISTLLTFNKLKSITTDESLVASAIEDSKIISLSSDKKMIRRQNELPADDDSNSRTLYVKGYPEDDPEVTIDSIAEQFSQFGKVCMVRMRKLADTKQFKGSCFIEFAHADDVKNAVSSANDGGVVKLSFKGKPFLCVMSFLDWAERKKNKLAKTSAAAADPNAGSKRKREGDDDKVLYTPGLIISVSNLPIDANLNSMKTFFKSLADVKFVDYQTGESTAFIRTADAAASATLQAALKEGLCLPDSDVKLAGSVLEGDAEEDYWKKIDQGSKRKGNGKGKGGGGFKGGRGGGYKKSKR